MAEWFELSESFDNEGFINLENGTYVGPAGRSGDWGVWGPAAGNEEYAMVKVADVTRLRSRLHKLAEIAAANLMLPPSIPIMKCSKEGNG